MREIKFRAWVDEFKVMFYQKNNSFDFMEAEKGVEECAWHKPKGNLSNLIKKCCPIMQYTGLKDKNGKEIYEGDVIQWYDDFGTDQFMDVRPIIDKIVFECGGFYPILEIIDGDSEIEIIGNIYENPELLERS